VVDLVFEYRLPTAIEYADREASTRKLNLQFHDESIRSILKNIIQQDSEYRVNFEEEVVDIFSAKAREADGRFCPASAGNGESVHPLR
jgi:hypothetical protein